MQQIRSFTKQILFTLFFFATSVFVYAQNKTAYELTVNGVKVIVQPSGNKIVEIQTLIRGGVQNYPANKAGIESLAMSALTECGTAKDDKNSFKNKLDKVSAQINGSAGKDYSTFTLNCIQSDLETVWPLYVDALTAPRFDVKEFERIKQDAINGIKAQASQPDYAINKLAKETAFAGKDYAKAPEGTEENVKALSAAETKGYYSAILTRSRLLIVIVGELDKATIESKIQALLTTIPAGQPFTLKKESYTPAKNTFTQEKKELATNYIQGVTGGPLPGTPDFNAFRIAMQILYDRHFLEVRTNNGLSYAPYTYFDGGTSPSANIVVSTTDPNKYIAVANKLIDKTRKEGFKPEELKDMKTTYVTSFFYKQETNAAQASSLAANEILHNNWRRSLTLNDDIKKLTTADLNRVFNKYITNITWVYQGDPAKVNPELYKEKIGSKEKLPESKLTQQKKD